MLRSRKARMEKEVVAVTPEKVVEDLDPDEQLAVLSRRRSVSIESARENSKSNRVYQTIKREIEIREKNHPDDIPSSDQVFFVDKQRNAAVVIGQSDLKTDVKNKKKKIRQASEPASSLAVMSLYVTAERRARKTLMSRTLLSW